jgi:hypothetical protein
VNPDPLVRKWREAIVADAEARLGRPLLDHERRFIESRTGLLALEMIHDNVRAAGAAELERYLASELPSRPPTA